LSFKGKEEILKELVTEKGEVPARGIFWKEKLWGRVPFSLLVLKALFLVGNGFKGRREGILGGGLSNPF